MSQKNYEKKNKEEKVQQYSCSMWKPFTFTSILLCGYHEHFSHMEHGCLIFGKNKSNLLQDKLKF